jgi:hypothetical protein
MSSPQVNWQQVAPNGGWSTGADDGAAAWRPTRTAHFSFEEFTSISPLARPLFLVFRGFLSSRLFLVFIRLLCPPNFSPFTGRRVSDTKQAAASGHLLSIDEYKENKSMRLFIQNIVVCLILTPQKNKFEFYLNFPIFRNAHEWGSSWARNKFGDAPGALIYCSGSFK